MAETLIRIGLMLTVWVTLPLLLLAAVFMLFKKSKREPEPTGCLHATSAKLKVTQMGDDDEYYLCQKCLQKLARSEFNGRISR